MRSCGRRDDCVGCDGGGGRMTALAKLFLIGFGVILGAVVFLGMLFVVVWWAAEDEEKLRGK